MPYCTPGLTNPIFPSSGTMCMGLRSPSPSNVASFHLQRSAFAMLKYVVSIHLFRGIPELLVVLSITSISISISIGIGF